MRTLIIVLLALCIVISGCENPFKTKAEEPKVRKMDRPDSKNEMIDHEHASLLSAVLHDNPDECRTVALIFFAKHELPGSVKTMLDKGAKINRSERYYGETPLIAAASMLSYECVELLLERGADVNATDKEGRTALDHAMKFEPPKISGVFYTNQPKVIELLKRYGAR